MDEKIEKDRDEDDEEQQRNHFGDDPERLEREPNREREHADKRPHCGTATATSWGKRFPRASE